MKLKTFDGGKNIRVDPSLILANEAVTYQNINNESLVLKSEKDYTLLAQEVRGQFYNFKGEWLSSDGERSYVEYKDVLYYSEISKEAKRYDGFREIKLGITPPDTAPTATQANPTASEKISASAITLQYCYTYYNSQDNIESVPSPISTELNLDADKVVDITDLVQSTDTQVDKIRLYRIGDGITEFTLVMEVDNLEATLRDDLPTVDLPGSLLDSVDNYPAPEGIRFLTEAYGIMFGAVGDKLVFSTIGKPEYWPAAFEIDFASDLKGILPIAAGILVFTENSTRLIVGSNATEFKKLKVTDEQGSISHLSGKTVKTIPVWLSKDGFCTFVNGGVEVLSKDKLGKQTLSVKNAVVHDEIYYVCLTDGTLLAMDARYGLIFKDLAFSSNIGNIHVYNDTLYGRVSETLCTLLDGSDLSMNYLSPVFTEDVHSMAKVYNTVYVRANGTFTIDIYISGTVIHTDNISGDDIFELKIPQESQRGFSIQFGITGTGIIYEIEYKVLGRQNGR